MLACNCKLQVLLLGAVNKPVPPVPLDFSIWSRVAIMAVILNTTDLEHIVSETLSPSYHQHIYASKGS